MDETQKLTLKNQALLERISNLTTEYESKIADLRVELTLVSNETESLKEQLGNALQNETEVVNQDGEPIDVPEED